MKKLIKRGEDYDSPKDNAKVTLSVKAATDGSAAIAAFTAKTLEFIAGNGEVCDALECAVGDMKKGEHAVLTIKDVAMGREAKLGLDDIKTGQIVLTVELCEFSKPTETWNMSEDEKVAFGTARKDVGTALFKGSRITLALERYKKVCELFSYIDNFKEENKAKATELKRSCEANKAACYLKLFDFVEAKKACNLILKDEQQNVKAIFRRAQAELGLKNFSECIRDCKKVVELDLQNKDARTLLKKARAGQREVDKQAKGLFTNMCKALGKGPIPEPGRSKRPHDEVDDDEVEEDMPVDAGEPEDKKEPEEATKQAAVAA